MLDKKNDCVWIGGDSMGSNGDNKNIYLQPKVFKVNALKDIVIASSSTFRHIDLLRYSETLFDDVDNTKEINHKYMVTKFIPKIIKLFGEGIKNFNDQSKGGSFLVGVKNRLFEIQCDYSIVEHSFGFSSVGCATYFAMGAAYVVKDLDITTPKKIEMVLEAAEKCANGVERPFTILNTKNDEIITVI